MLRISSFHSRIPTCYYGRTTTMRTSWIGKNPRRRFVYCGQDEIYERAMEVIPRLLRRIRNMEVEIGLGADKKCEDAVESLKVQNQNIIVENKKFKLKA